MRHINIKIFGQVQGINFRWNTRRKALQLDIFGFVRNLPDGTVFVEAEGEEANLAKLVAWSKKGTFWSKVSKVEVVEDELKHYNDFEIKY